jgi:hypothetical protein
MPHDMYLEAERKLPGTEKRTPPVSCNRSFWSVHQLLSLPENGSQDLGWLIAALPEQPMHVR